MHPDAPVSPPGFGRRALCTLGLLTLAAFSPALAQSAGRTTPGRLLAGRTDTIEVERSASTELGQRRARLRLSRTDSGFVGLLQLHSYHVDQFLHVGYTPRNWQCDTAMTSFLPRALAERLLALVDSTVIEPGAPRALLPSATDISLYDAFRLSGPTGAVVVRDARAVVHRDSMYRVPFEMVRADGPSPLYVFREEPTSLTRARRMLDAYLRWEDLPVFSQACVKK